MKSSFLLCLGVVSLLLSSSLVHSINFFSKDSPWDLLLTPGLIFPTPREGHTATLIDNNVYVYGGYYPSRAFWGRERVPQVVYDQLFVLNMNTFEWKQLGGVPVPEQPFHFFGNRHAVEDEEAENGILVARAPEVTDEDVITQSSFRFLSEEQVEEIVKTARKAESENENPSTARQTSSDPPSLASHCAAQINGQLYIFGGLLSPGNVVTNNLYRYNPVKNSWALISSGKGPAARAGATSWAHDGRFYIFGGYDPALPTAFSDTWYYDTKTLKWNLVPSSPTVPGPRVFTSAVETRVYQAVLYSGQTNVPYAEGELANSVSVFNTNWTSVFPTQKVNPRFPLPASNAASAYYYEREAYVSIGGLAGPWARQINRCGWYNPSENNFVGFDAVGDVRIFSAETQNWQRGSDAPFWSYRNLTGRVFGSATVHYGNNLFFFGGVGCEDLIGRGFKPYPAMYGRFNQVPVYNIYFDQRTAVASSSTLELSLSVLFVFVMSVLVLL